MNREILFRGKRVDNGEWIIRSIIEVVGDKVFIDYIEVIPETVGQFTGLTDKNGTNIFEGDVMSDYRGVQHIVKFVDWCVAFILERKTDKVVTTTRFFHDEEKEYINGEYRLCRYEITGNIHDK